MAAGRDVQADIVDCTPTILALLGLPIPEDMQGRVITELFDHPPMVEAASAQATVASELDDAVYSEEDLQKVTERLSDLGYLE